MNTCYVYIYSDSTNGHYIPTNCRTATDAAYKYGKFEQGEVVILFNANGYKVGACRYDRSRGYVEI